MEAFKRTLRRELDLWRAYGATPDSNYLGATPDILIDLNSPPTTFLSMMLGLKYLIKLSFNFW